MIIVATRLRTSSTRLVELRYARLQIRRRLLLELLERVERLRELAEAFVGAAHVVEERRALRRIVRAPVVGERLLIAEGDHRLVAVALVLLGGPRGQLHVGGRRLGKRRTRKNRGDEQDEREEQR